MSSRLALRRFLLAVVLTGCGGEEEPRCIRGARVPVSELTTTICIPAMLYAARDSSKLMPTQEEIDRYYGRLERAVAAERLLYGWPYVYRGQALGQISFYTRNEPLIAAWRDAPTNISPLPNTADPAVDAILSELAEAYLQHPPRLALGTDDVYVMSIAALTPFNEELLHERLLPTGSFLPDPTMSVGGDGFWRWIDAEGSGTNEATAELHVHMGWGDCTSGCEGFHDFLAIMPPEGAVTVYDLGGDPLPPGYEPSPNTKPPP